MKPIQEAISYIRTTVQAPALESKTLPDEIKRKVKHSDIWLDHFERVGDLISYLQRFQIGTNDPTFKTLKEHNLLTFEDISKQFVEKFSYWANDCTRPTDFIVGEKYSPHQILIFAKSYDTRAGGMFVLESGGKPTAVIIKATLSGGTYPNQWLEEPNRLKYYLKSIGNDYGEHFKPNAAIINNQDIPILTFVRTDPADRFTYQGIFKYKDIHREPDQTKWFELERNKAQTDEIEDAAFKAKVFEEQTKASRQSSREQRLNRLANASKKPQATLVLSTDYKRNPDVVAEVLERANGVCEGCEQDAPFIRKSDNTPYLEVHHRKPLAKDGEDTVENAIALCPNCHRKAHFG